MQVSIESLEGLERRMTVQVPTDIVQSGVEKKLNDLRKTIKIDGFRPGKVPLKVVQQKFGGHVRQEVIDDVIESSYREALVQENVRPAGMPSIESIESEDKENMSFTAIFEIYPEIEEIKLDAIKVKKPVVEITDDDLQTVIQKLREQRKEWSEVSRAAGKGDQVLVDFEGRIDGEIFEGGTGKEMAVEIGAGAMLPEFEAGLEGISSGEEKLVMVNFPDDYHGKDVAGKTAEFSLRAIRVSEGLLPEVDQEFAKAYGIEDGNLEKLRVDVRANMGKEISQKLKTNLKNAVMEGLLEHNKVIAPSALVAEEVKSLKQQAIQRMGQDPETFDHDSLPNDLFEQEADKRVRLGLLVGEVIKRENITLDNSLFESTLTEMTASYEQPDRVLEFYRQNQEARKGLESMVLEDQVVSHILDKAKVTENQSSFEEIMNNSN
jgi:trigger factor